MMKIGVIGGGVVGKATARCFMEHAEVRVYDKVSERATHSLQQALDTDLIFVCLPTPQLKYHRGCDLDYLDEFFSSVQGSTSNFVLRSTVPIGTTKSARETYQLPNLVHSPEFLTARCANTDALIPSRNIIGDPTGPAKSSHGGAMLEVLYLGRFPGVSVHYLTSDESEAVKLFTNGFFAVKIAYWNEVYSFSKKLGLDWERVLGAVLADGRIAYSHTKVPGPDGSLGFGGSCLPKDLSNLITCIETAECLAHVTRAASERNCIDRGEQ